MSCFYNNYDYNLNNQLGALGTASRFSGLFAGQNSSIFTNMFGYGFSNYGMFNSFGNYGTFGGYNSCGCGMSPWARIGFTLANSITTIFGTWGLSALSNKINKKSNEAPVKQETLASVEKDFNAQLNILGLDGDINTFDISELETVSADDTALEKAKTDIDTAKAKVEHTETGLEKVSQSITDKQSELTSLRLKNTEELTSEEQTRNHQKIWFKCERFRFC